MLNTQNIRRSQFILTYGPGAIIEGEKGSRIIPSLENGLENYFSDEMLEKFEIRDARMRNILERNDEGERTRIFALPSNAALNKSEFTPIYYTYIFPLWRICYNKKHNIPILFRGRKCPECGNKEAPNVRFVASCPEGHMDDVNWDSAVHKEKKCDNYYFFWKARGSSLADIKIECPKCKSKSTMEQIYKTNFPCSGRIPENERKEEYYNRPKRNWRLCKGKMKVIQRQSTAIRIPETITLLTIPQYDNSFIRILQRNDVKVLVEYAIRMCPDGKKFINSLNGILPERKLRILSDYIYENGYENFVIYVKDLFENKKTINTLLEEEFESLRGKMKITSNFQIRKPISYDFPDYDGFKVDVYPIDKLRTVTVQKGYRRMPYMKKEGESSLIESYAYDSLGERWYPGFEGIGEGIFISSYLNPLEFLSGPSIDEWKTRKNMADENTWHGSQISWRDGAVRDPQFVWWHTLSHLLIRTLSLISGYSSASLRERVYISSSLTNGGILIYTSSAGEDGGMGGLVESTGKFDNILEYALESVSLCSNDPLCSEIRVHHENVNGSACHNCLMTSETSCEHGNRWLDRHMILGD